MSLLTDVGSWVASMFKSSFSWNIRDTPQTEKMKNEGYPVLTLRDVVYSTVKVVQDEIQGEIQLYTGKKTRKNIPEQPVREGQENDRTYLTLKDIFLYCYEVLQQELYTNLHLAAHAVGLSYGEEGEGESGKKAKEYSHLRLIDFFLDFYSTIVKGGLLPWQIAKSIEQFYMKYALAFIKLVARVVLIISAAVVTLVGGFFLCYFFFLR